MYNKARAAEAAQTAHAAKAKNLRDLKAVAKGRPPNGAKRRAQAQPETQPGAKRPTTRSAARAEKDEDDEDVDAFDGTPEELSTQQSDAEPAKHSMGLLSAVGNAGLGDSNAATPRQSPDIEDEDEADDRSAMPPRMRTPDPPKGLGEFDDQGAALMQRGPKANNRIAVKPPFQFDPIDIGFRDSTNDHAKIKNPSARGKYLDQPNTDILFHDRAVWTYDAAHQKKSDLDKELVGRFGVHSKYGVFTPHSRNPSGPRSETTESHPVVFLPPSGETLHASRSYQAVVTAKNVESDVLARKMTSTLDALYESNPDLSAKTRKPAKKEGIPKEYSGPSLGLLQREVTQGVSMDGSSDEMQTPEPAAQVDDVEHDAGDPLSPLVKAAIFASAEDSSTQRSVTPAKTVSRPYDAIRDVFTSSSPKPQAEPALNLSVLAEVCGWGPQTTHTQPPMTSGLGAEHGHPQHPYGLPQLAPAPASMMGQQQYAQEPPPQFQSPWPPSVREREGHANRPEPYSEPSYPPQNTTAPPPYQYQQYETQGPVSSHREPYPMSGERDAEPRHYQPQAEAMIDPRLRGLDHERPSPYYEHDPHRHVAPGYPPPPATMHNPLPAPPHPGTYGPPPPPPRREFSSSSSTTLPPLRPPRQPGQPYEAPPERGAHPHSRISSISSAGQYYPPGPPPQFHNSFGPPEQPPHMMGGGPSPYGQQPNTGYRQGTLSPTYSSAQIPFQSLAPTPPPATPPQGSASLGTGSGRRATFQHYTPAVPSPQQNNNAKYRKLEPAPVPPHRVGWNNEPQLRTVGYNPTEDIKDYSAIEPLPGRGPTFIRGWNVSSGARKRGSRGGRDEKDDPR